jgi:hypothetical protein
VIGGPPHRPGLAKIGEPTPQSDPQLFTDAEITAEIKHLVRLNRRHGSHPQRTAAYLRLAQVLADRRTP